jgi:hypothetical protein
MEELGRGGGGGRGARGGKWKPRGHYLEQHPPPPFNPYYFAGYVYDPYLHHRAQFRPPRALYPRNQDAAARGVGQNQHNQ